MEKSKILETDRKLPHLFKTETGEWICIIPRSPHKWTVAETFALAYQTMKERQPTLRLR